MCETTPPITPRSAELRKHILGHKDEVEALAKRVGIKNVRVFGSVAQGCADEGSDIDILASRDGICGLFKIAEAQNMFESLLGIDVDFVLEDCIKENRRAEILNCEIIWVC